MRKLMFILCVLPAITMATMVEYMATNQDQSLLALSFENKVLRVYSLKSSKLLKESKVIDDEDEYSQSMGFMDDEHVAVMFSGRRHYVWDYIHNTVEKKRTTTKILMDLASREHEKRFKPASQEKWRYHHSKITIYKADTKTQKAFVGFAKELGISEIEHIAFSHDGKLASLTLKIRNNPMQVMIIDTTTYKIKQMITPMSKGARKTEFIGDHMLLLDSGYPIELWDIDASKKHFSFVKSGSRSDLTIQDIAKKEFVPYTIGKSINGLDVNPKTGNIAVTGTGYPIGSIEIHAKGGMTKLFQNNYSRGYDTRYSPDGKYVAFAFHGEHLLVYDATTGALDKKYDLGGVPNGTRVIKFSRDSSLLAAGSDGNTLHIIDVASHKIIDKINFSSGVFSLQWLSNDKILVGTMLELYELDLTTHKKKTILESPTIALDTYWDNGKLSLLAIGRNGASTLLLDGQYKQITTMNMEGVGRINFDKYGKHIIVSSQNGMGIWDYQSGKLKTCISSDESLWAMATDKDKDLIYIAGDNGKVEVWNLKCKLLTK